MSLRELLEARATKIGEMRAMLDLADSEGRDLTEDEAKAYDTLKADQEKLSKKIERLEDQEKLESMLQQARPAKSQQSTFIPRAGGPEAKREFDSLGEFLHSVCWNRKDQRLSSLYSEFEPKAQQRMDTGAAGGFLIPEQFRGEIMSVPSEEAIVRPRAFALPAGDSPDAKITMPLLDQSGQGKGARRGGVRTYWVSEGNPIPQTSAQFKQLSLAPNRMAALLSITNTMLSNFPVAETYFTTLLREAIIAEEEESFLYGDGIAKPLGLMNSTAPFEVARAVQDHISYGDITAMESRLLGKNGIWIFSNPVMKELRDMVNPAGQLIWSDAKESAPATLLGRPAIKTEFGPMLGDAGDLWLLDLSYYVIKDGSGPFINVSTDRLFDTDETLIRVTWSVDGQPSLKDPIRLEKSGYEVSPFVKLV